MTSENPAFDSGDQAWVLISTALVFIMTPALGLFYSGLTDKKNSMAMMQIVMINFAVIAIQWALFGYSLALSDMSNSTFIGNLQYGALLTTLNIPNKMAPTIPASLFSLYQLMFAGITPGLYLGATAGRMKMFPTMVFVFLWSTIVYDPVVYWVWASNGWLHNLGILDYAGGSVVHVSAGVTALVLAMMVGKRQDFDDVPLVNHSPPWIYIGTAFLWFGWMGFNGGSSVSSNARAVGAVYASNLAASAGGLVWMGLETVYNNKKFSSIAFCTGAVAGLATITPGSGFVQPGFGIIFGGLAGVVCFFAARFFKSCGIDDTLDVAGVHGVGGTLGMLLTGIFAQTTVTDLDVSNSTSGWIDKVWIQVPVQLAAIAAVGAWSAIWSILFISIMNHIPLLRLRASPQAELSGLDDAEVGEWSSQYLLDPEGIDRVVHPDIEDALPPPNKDGSSLALQ
ncbi:UNVERIFIED_CONTAM: hypothetical protein HDU68_004886 [Siphonaria sp. JEL0065]|nr:hypothetical protein HDU68_004886 [Siphonaria sp. JEL0065]